MSSLKRMLPLALVLMLCSCEAADVRTANLISPDNISTVDVNYKTTEIMRGTISDKYTVTGQIVYPMKLNIYTEERNITVIEIAVTEKAYVKEGDILAKFKYDETALRMKINTLQEQVESRRANFEIDIKTYEDQIVRYRDLQRTNSSSQTAKLRADKAVLSRDIFVKNFERDIEELEEKLREEIEKLDGYFITAPFDGVVTGVKFFPEDKVLENIEFLMTIQDTTNFYITVKGDQRKYHRNQVISVSVPSVDKNKQMPGVLISDPSYADPGSKLSDFVVWYDEIPDSTEELYGRSIQIVTETLHIENVLLIPKEAVKSEVVPNESFTETKRWVTVFENGMQRKRYIKVGWEDLYNFEVVEGLDEGEIVVIN